MGLDSHQAVAGRSNGHGPKNTYRSRGECALVIQMACTHSAAMAVFHRLGGASADRTVAGMASVAARLLRAYATQVEALRRLRHGGSQTLRVEHVHVNEGGQAIIGNVRSGTDGMTLRPAGLGSCPQSPGAALLRCDGDDAR